MLEHLHIENMAVIASADPDISPGFTVLTGETGAGKSVLINSLNLLLGERVSRDCVRAGCAKATVSGVFSHLSPALVQALNDAGVDMDGGELLIQRDLSVDGKSSVRANGRPVTVSMLHAWAGHLINIHGQHDNRALLDPSTHERYLDAFARDGEELRQYQTVFGQLKQVLSEIKSVSFDEQERIRRIDMLEYQINEIDAVALKRGEAETLEQRRTVLANAEKIAASASAAYEDITRDDGGRDALSAALASLEHVHQIDPELGALHERLNDLCAELEDISYDLRDYINESASDPSELDAVEERLEQIRTLEHKYGADYDSIIAFRDQAEKERNALQSSAETLQELNRKKTVLYQQLKQASINLTEVRRRAIPTLEKKLTEQLTFLDMPNTRFSVRLEPSKEFTPTGADEIEFLLSANPGQPVQPLSKIASGGELSRIMLGMKTVLTLDEDAETLIFDEIDTGVSGKAAEKIAMKLKELSRDKQVIVVTHLAQIAAYADNHFLISKTVSESQTYTTVEPLDHEGRKTELARIVGGMNPTPAAVAAAEDLLRIGAEYMKS